MPRRSKRSAVARATGNSGEGVLTLLDVDATDTELEAAVRALYGLPDDYVFSDEADAEWAAERTKAESGDELRDDLQ